MIAAITLLHTSCNVFCHFSNARTLLSHRGWCALRNKPHLGFIRDLISGIQNSRVKLVLDNRQQVAPVILLEIAKIFKAQFPYASLSSYSIHLFGNDI